MAVTLWTRQGDRESDEARAFLRRHGYRPDAVRDLDAQPPSAQEWSDLAKALGDLRLAIGPNDVEPPADVRLNEWLAQEPRRIRAPMLVTPKGAVAGFRERAWMRFLDIGSERRG